MIATLLLIAIFLLFCLLNKSLPDEEAENCRLKRAGEEANRRERDIKRFVDDIDILKRKDDASL